MAEFAHSVGGTKAKGAIKRIADKFLGEDPVLKVGFLENATYPDGTPVALIAMIQEYGARIEREPSDPADGGGVTIYRRMNASGTKFLKRGRFVKKKQSNFATMHYVGAHVITIPPRPFFRTMIEQNEASWAPATAKLLKQGMKPMAALAIMGEVIAGQLRASIIAMNSPPNAPSTIRKKGSAKPLVDTGLMLNSVDYEVVQGKRGWLGSR